jgi:LL-diaminopimelate aminotransferase
MIRINENYNLLQGSYLFSEVNKRVKAYQEKNTGRKIIRLGIGDVTQPLSPSVIAGMKRGVEDMASAASFKGYGPDQGYDFLREAICDADFQSHGINIGSDEIFITTGAKEDTANIQELFAQDIRIAIPDPVYPVYVDSNVMAGRSGAFTDGRYRNFVYLDCNERNHFTPSLPSEPVDLIYLCFPNNPTGQVATKEELKKWVDYARKNRALILFDAAYEAFIRDPGIPHSIYEIEGAREVAIEFRSLSKTAGFTGTRCAYTMIPRDLMAWDAAGNPHSLNQFWFRRQSTKFNGTAYVIQRAAEQVFSSKGKEESRAIIDYYLGNAKLISEGIKSQGWNFSGGTNSPYIWFKTPDGLNSWEFFDRLLSECQVVGTPGAGFGKCGEGYFRLSSFGSRENVQEAMERILQVKF